MLRLMIVDDEQIIREALSEMIDYTSIGYELIATTKNGMEAYDVICDEYPDVVITDIRMPILNGLDLIERSMKSDSKIDLLGADTASLQAGPEQKRKLYSRAGKRFQNHLIVERVHSLVRLPVDKQQGLETTVEPLPRLAEVEDSHDRSSTAAPISYWRNQAPI